MNLKLETKRLYLRPINEDDDQDFFEMDSNPKVHEFLGNKPVTSIEQSRGYIKSILQQYKDNGVAVWL
jgi:RimJ/RimL family protein N-acetyltransferase